MYILQATTLMSSVIYGTDNVSYYKEGISENLYSTSKRQLYLNSKNYFNDFFLEIEL